MGKGAGSGDHNEDGELRAHEGGGEAPQASHDAANMSTANKTASTRRKKKRSNGTQTAMSASLYAAGVFRLTSSPHPPPHRGSGGRPRVRRDGRRESEDTG